MASARRADETARTRTVRQCRFRAGVAHWPRFCLRQSRAHLRLAQAARNLQPPYKGPQGVAPSLLRLPQDHFSAEGGGFAREGKLVPAANIPMASAVSKHKA